MSPGTSAGGDGGGVESDGSATASDGSTTASDGSAAEGDDAGRTRADPAAGRRRASLLWGLVGALAFLVLVQGFELLGGQSVTVAVKAGVAVAVGVAAAVSSYLFGAWLAARREG